jgi:hypothetical protein
LLHFYGIPVAISEVLIINVQQVKLVKSLDPDRGNASLRAIGQTLGVGAATIRSITFISTQE